jgi:hypothetical protein
VHILEKKEVDARIAELGLRPSADAQAALQWDQQVKALRDTVDFSHEVSVGAHTGTGTTLREAPTWKFFHAGVQRGVVGFVNALNEAGGIGVRLPCITMFISAKLHEMGLCGLWQCERCACGTASIDEVPLF